MTPSARRPRRAAAVAAACGAVIVAVMLAGCAQAEPSPAGAATQIAPESTTAPIDEVAGVLDAGGLQDPSASGAGTPASTATPTRVSIPAIGVDTALESLNLAEGGELNAPADYDLAGWYAGGVVPGAVGPAIIAGHVDSPTAPAVFVRLGDLAPGAEVVVTMSDGSALTFEVTGTTQSAKSNFPTAEVYDSVPSPQLRLITCSGTFDSAVGHYTDNLIVFAALRN